MKTTRPLIYRKARSVAVRMIHFSPQKSTNAEVRDGFEYETSLWVDGLTGQCAEEFCSLLHSSVNNSFHHGITVAQAWENASLEAAMPPICFSPLLTASLTTATTASKRFMKFTCQVVAKCLLFHHHPLPLASLITHSLANIVLKRLDPEDLIAVDQLRCYSQSLITFAGMDAKKRVTLLCSLIDTSFSRGCLQSMIAESILAEGSLDLSRASFSESDCVVAARQCLHVATLALNTSDYAKQSVSYLHALIPLVVLVSDVILCSFSRQIVFH